MYNFCAAKLKGYIYIAIRLAVKKKGAEAFVFTKNIHYYFYHFFFFKFLFHLLLFFITLPFLSGQRKGKIRRRNELINWQVVTL